MCMIFLGAPGVGKGTQAQKLAAEEGIAQVSTGEILRESMRQGTSLGMQAKSYVDAGRLVPDDVVIGIIRDRLASFVNGRRYILDGFPRTVAQAEALDRMLQSGESSISHVVNFEVPKEELIRRLSGRRSCANCQAVYHIENAPPRTNGQCDKCGGPLVQRSDDKPETVEARLDVYEKQTSPLVGYYEKRGLLRRIDARDPIEKVHRRLLDVIHTAKST